MDLDIIYNHAKHVMENDPSGHDLNHLSRVTNLAMAIADSENFTQWEKDMTLVAVYLHDTIDDKVISNREQAIETAILVMQQANMTDNEIEITLHSIINEPFSRNLNGFVPLHKTGQVCREADYLDGIGAIGIGRVFLYSGIKGRPIYSDDEPRDVHGMTIEEYRKGEANTMNHFVEKLFGIRDFMRTDLGKKIAEERTKVMKDFYTTFFKELNLKDI
ncbi:HD domain protein [Aerococcus phage vB_AviM_AVP]|nr:HD domain protein [Aerococcus phage vB_AviM_AVP]